MIEIGDLVQTISSGVFVKDRTGTPARFLINAFGLVIGFLPANSDQFRCVVIFVDDQVFLTYDRYLVKV